MSQSFDQNLVPPDHANKQDSPLRSLMAKAAGSSYVSFTSLEDAQNDDNGVMIMEGDDGGTIYVVCPARRVRCSQQTLERLLCDIDAHVWNEPDMAHIFYERATIGQGIAGGMGGGLVTDDIWVHAKLNHLADSVRAVIAEVRSRLD